MQGPIQEACIESLKEIKLANSGADRFEVEDLATGFTNQITAAILTRVLLGKSVAKEKLKRCLELVEQVRQEKMIVDAPLSKFKEWAWMHLSANYEHNHGTDY